LYESQEQKDRVLSSRGRKNDSVFCRRGRKKRTEFSAREVRIKGECFSAVEV